jgi:4-hydroxy-3-methylbut-2-en-1-yl diphosphate reductase
LYNIIDQLWGSAKRLMPGPVPDVCTGMRVQQSRYSWARGGPADSISDVRGIMLRVILANPRGFCAGVVRAIETVESALAETDGPVFVRHEIVHNQHVVETRKAKGAHFVEDLKDVPPGAVTVFSAHGVSRAVEAEARRRHLDVIDATCPLVSKVHKEGQRYAAQGREIILIGHAGHPEVEGTKGQINGRVHLVADAGGVSRLGIPTHTPVAYITQTTLSVDDTRATIDAIKARFSNVVGPETRDICYATQNRQTSVRALCEEADVILVVGSPNSSNTLRLHEIAREQGVAAYLVGGGQDLDPAWFTGARTIGITAGASAPEVLVQDVINTLRCLSPIEVSTLPGVEETIQFRLPQRLTQAAS